MTVLYIDVSHYDWDRNKGNLDWNAIRNSGIDIAFIRATYGDPQIYSPQTRYFREMATAAKNAGLKVGGYHNLINGDFSSIKRQVSYFRTELNSVRVDYAMVDIEPYDALKTNNLWPRLASAELFAQEFKNQDAERNLAVYLAQWVWNGYMDRADLRPLIEKAIGPLINASYSLGTEKGDYASLYLKSGGVSGKGWAPYGNVAPEIWQYTSNSSVPGASSLTDANAFKGTVFQLDDRLRVTGKSALTDRDRQWISAEIRNAWDRG